MTCRYDEDYDDDADGDDGDDDDNDDVDDDDKCDDDDNDTWQLAGNPPGWHSSSALKSVLDTVEIVLF